MKDKVVFFILGALLATIAYLAGDLETLTAQDETLELEEIQVGNLFVKDTLYVGDRGTMYVQIGADNQSAHLSLFGTKVEKTPDSGKPYIVLRAMDNGAIIQANSHPGHPEASAFLGITNSEGKYISGMLLQDSDGQKYVSTDP